jgi:hypothetical protein
MQIKDEIQKWLYEFTESLLLLVPGGCDDSVMIRETLAAFCQQNAILCNPNL